MRRDKKKVTKVDEGLILLNKPAGITSFGLVSRLRRITNIRKIGHAGTLDPFATGLMILLIGRGYTRKSAEFTNKDKAYEARIFLGRSTSTYDLEGETTSTSDLIPSLEAVQAALAEQQGERLQIPPMFSAKKIGGKKLYELARQGQVIERAPAMVAVEIERVHYSYPYLDLHITCSKGTYIRSIAHDVGEYLGTGAHLERLKRTRCGPFTLEESIALDALEQDPHLWKEVLRT